MTPVARCCSIAPKVIEAADAAGIAIEAFRAAPVGRHRAETGGRRGRGLTAPWLNHRGYAWRWLARAISAAIMRASIAQLEEAELVGIVDTDPDRARRVAEEFSTAVLPDLDALPGSVDAASVAVPDRRACRVGCRLLEHGIDVLVEKPMAASLAEADRLIVSASRHGRILQVGHLERFNPGVLAALARRQPAAVFRSCIASACSRRAAWILTWCTT